jgi:hypothetical protein
MEHAGCRNGRSKSAKLPFAGLGLELGAVFAWADSLTLRSARAQGESLRTGIVPGVAVMSGYALLLWLNREIRGC